MTAASQKRMLTAANSKLTKTDLPVRSKLFIRPLKHMNSLTKTQEILRKPRAWDTLPLEKRQQIYSLLPPPREGDQPYDPDVNPLDSSLGKDIEEELRRWQSDLKAGKETKKWRDEAMQAGRDRMSGKFDVVMRAERDRRRGEGNVVGNDWAEDVKGEDKHDVK